MEDIKLVHYPEVDRYYVPCLIIVTGTTVSHNPNEGLVELTKI